MKKLTLGSATVAAVLAAVFAHEGGYVNDLRDPGGETNYGITVAVARDYGYTGPMRNLTKETASNIYLSNYINKPGYGELITLSPAVGQKVVDAAVNTGTARSSRWLQTALNSYSRGGLDYPQLTVDGKVGAGTNAAYAALQKKRGKVKACELVIKAIDTQQGQHYMSLTHLSQYTAGWMDNRVGNVPLSLCKEDYRP